MSTQSGFILRRTTASPQDKPIYFQRDPGVVTQNVHEAFRFPTLEAAEKAAAGMPGLYDVEFFSPQETFDLPKSVHSQWLDYKKKVIPKTASETQIKETRRGFYAGAVAMMQLTKQASAFPEPTAVRFMECYDRELKEFNEDVKRGFA